MRFIIFLVLVLIFSLLNFSIASECEPIAGMDPGDLLFPVDMNLIQNKLLGGIEVLVGVEVTQPLSACDPLDDPLVFIVTNMPNGMIFDIGNKILKWVPTIEQIGTYYVYVQVNDQPELNTNYSYISGTTSLFDKGTIVFKVDRMVADILFATFFYNNSYFDDRSNDEAIATDKIALLPGETATFANYTSYNRGINGIMIDMIRLYGSIPTVNDCTFRVGNSNDPGNWVDAPFPSSFTVRQGEGINGSDRIEIMWPDNAIQKKWLQVTVLATTKTFLDQPKTFYFGNAPGDTGNKITDANVNVLDVSGIRDNSRNIFNPALINNRYDINRDRNVNVLDACVVRDNATNIFTALKLITPLKD